MFSKLEADVMWFVVLNVAVLKNFWEVHGNIFVVKYDFGKLYSKRMPRPVFSYEFCEIFYWKCFIRVL